jgi:hypothetical protein
MFKSDKEKCFYLLRCGMTRNYSPKRMVDILEDQLSYKNPFVIVIWVIQFLWIRARRQVKWERVYKKWL